MKTFKYFLYMLSILAVACFVSCSDNDDDNSGKKPTPGGNTPDSKLTPDQHKEKIENIGKNFVAEFKSSENEAIAKSLYDLEELISDSNFDEIFDIPASDLNRSLKGIASVITKNNLEALTRAGSDVEEYSWAKYTGIYTYSGREWKKAAANNKVEIQYDSEAGKSVLTATYSDVKHYTNIDGYDVEVPGKINMTLKVANQEVLNLAVTIDLKSNQQEADANVKLVVSSNYIWTAKVKATGSKVNADYSMTIRGKEVMNASAEVTGNRMTDPDYVDKNEDYLEKVFSDATLYYQLMDIAISGKADIKAIILGEEDDNVEWGDEKASKKNAEAEAKNFNTNAQVALYYVGNTEEKIAEIKMGTDWEEEYFWDGQQSTTWKDWYITPVLVFASDNSEFALEDYFTESRFSSLIDAAEKLANEFTKMLDLEPVEF